MENESQPSLTCNFKDDALSQVLGQDRPGRLRGMGRGMTATKAVLSQIKDTQVAQCQHSVSELKQVVYMLMKRLVRLLIYILNVFGVQKFQE